MRLTHVLPALVVVLALSGCGDDDSDTPDDTADQTEASPEADQVADQAAAILECTTAQDLPGAIGKDVGGVLGIDLTTENETIVVYVLGSEAEAADYQNPADLDQEQVGNVLIVGGAISPEHHEVIKQCIEDNPAG